MKARANSSETRLSARRRAARRRFRILLAILFILLVAGFFYLLWQPYVRIKTVTVNDGDEFIVTLAREQLVGTYARIVPRDSYLFVSEQAMRTQILKTHPELESVSISRSSLTSLAITVTKRVPLARWCGTPIKGEAANTVALDTNPTGDGSCYLFDATGYIYAVAPLEGATSTDPGLVPLSDLRVYSSTDALTLSTDVIDTSVQNPLKIPAIFQLARSLAGLGAQVRTVVIRGDEVDLFLASGTRVTYVLGDEQGAFSLATSAFPQMNLADGSVEYVDLRFSASGRVYLKRNTK
jgi:cell division septal protein FtsQ